MPARNVVFQTEGTATYKQQRYWWEVIPAHEEALDDPEVVFLPTSLFGKGGTTGKRKRGQGQVPYGTDFGDSRELEVNIGAIADLALYTYMTDDGQGVLGAGTQSFCNTVWILYTDNGDSSLTRGQFSPCYIGVQTYYLGDEITALRNAKKQTMKITLTNAATWALQQVSMLEWSEACQERVPEYNPGGPDLFTDVLVQEISYEKIYRDGDGDIYAYATRTRVTGPGHFSQFVKYTEVFWTLQDLVNARFSALLRDPDYGMLLTSEWAAPFGDVGTPYDFVTRYRQDYTTNDYGIIELERIELLWELFVNIDDETTPIGGFFGPNEPLIKNYATVLDVLPLMTEEGGSRCEIQYGRFPSGEICCRLKWRKIWPTVVYDPADHTDNPISAMPTDAQWADKISIMRGGHYLGGARTALQIASEENRDEWSYTVAGVGDNVRPYEIKALLFSGPGLLPGADVYWLRIPTDEALPAQYRAFDVDFDDSKLHLVFAQSGRVSNRWFYRQENAANGGPAWITSDDDLAVACHQWATYDFGGWATGYHLMDASPTYTLPVMTGDKEDEDLSYYEQIRDALREACREAQKFNDLAHLTEGIGRMFSNRSQTIIKVGVRRPNVFSYMANRREDGDGYSWPIDADLFIPGLHPQLATEAVIVDREEQEEGMDTLTFFVRATTQ